MNSLPKIALIRGRHLNQFELQSYEPLVKNFDITGFGSWTSFHDKFQFPVVKLFSPIDVVDPLQRLNISSRISVGLMNRLMVDAQYLTGLEEKLRGFDIAHVAETYLHYTIQALDAKKIGYVKKVVSTVWENIPHNHEGIRGRRAFKQRAIREVDHFIAVTQQAKATLIAEGCEASKITVIYPGVDIERFYSSSRARSSTEKKSQFSLRSNNNLLFVGRLEPEKGVWFIFNIFQELHKKFPNLKLRFCGTGSQRAKLQRQIEELGLTSKAEIIASSYDQMPQQYQWADIFLVASQETKYWKEQFGMVLIEAMAAGLPVVARDSGAVAEVMSQAGIVCQNQEKYCQRLTQLVANPALRQKWGKRALKRATHTFSHLHASQAIAQVYRSIGIL